MKRCLLVVMLTLGMLSVDCRAQIQKEKNVEEDGFVWYELTDSKGRTGAQNSSKKTLIPLGEYMLISYNSSCGGFFTVTDWNHYEGVYTKYGQVVIPISQGYNSITLQGNYFEVERGRGKNNAKKGICDLSGREIIKPRFDYIIYLEDEGFKCRGFNGDWMVAGIKLDSDGIYRGN